MIHPRIDELMDQVDSRYALVIVAAKRARQINNYHHQLGEGIGFEEAPPPLIESRSKGVLSFHVASLYPDLRRVARALAVSYFVLASGTAAPVIMRGDTIDFGQDCQPTEPPTSLSPICRFLVATRTSTVSILFTSTVFISVFPIRSLAR